MKTKITLEIFINRARNIHHDKYIYSLVDFKDIRTKVKIICPEHGIFEQSPILHYYQKCGCPKCKTTSIEDFIKNSSKIHNNKYDYSLVKFVNTKTKIIIICPTHGEFEQLPNNHLNGNGCNKCGQIKTNIKNNKLLSYYITKSNELHNYKYIYENENIKIKAQDKISIICPIHGKFIQRISDHISGNGCPKCKSSKGENKVLKWLIDNNIKFTSQHRFNNCRNKRPLPFDFYLPDHNICIEYDGEQHFKPVRFKNMKKDISSIYERTKFHDNIKTKFCEDNDIKLLRIPYTKYNEIEQILSNIF